MKKIDKFFYLSLPVLFILGALAHFAFDISNNYLVGLFFPVNESIYEHTKLSFVPLLIIYIYGYIKFKLDLKRWLNTFLISLVASSILIPSIYYLYTSSLGFESVIVDILIFFISITLSQLLALHFYNKSTRLLDIKVIIIILITWFIVNAMLTLNPPKFPIFYDKTSNSYGISKK